MRNARLCLTKLTVLLAMGPLALHGAPGPGPAPVADAAENGDHARLLALLREGADANSSQVDGMTALHWAAYRNDFGTVKALIDHEARVGATNRYGITPLSLACLNGNGDLVKLLLEEGADPNVALRGGETALMTAARTGRVQPVQALLDAGADVNARERKGQTAIMWAASEGHAPVVRMLMKAGADYREPLKRSGFTPFFFAVRDGRSEVVQVFLEAGLDVNATIQPRRSGGKNPRKGMSPLLFAVENGHFELAVALLGAGADPNDQRSGYTPLHALTWVRKPNRGDGPDGDPAPYGSGKLSSLQFAKIAVDHGAKVNARLKSGPSGRGRLNKAGATPFFMAASTADVPYMRVLLELGADPTIRNVDNATALMAAAGLGTMAPTEEAGTEAECLAAVQLLLQLGADVNAVDDNGETAMHGAAYKNLPKMVQLLADHGARIDIWNRPNKYEWTPWSIAQGYRVGNFKPAPETMDALQRVMLAAGVTPTDSPTAKSVDIYAPAKKNNGNQ